MDTSFDGIKILLVDDEPDILEFLRYNLEREGFIVYSAGNGREAIKIAGAEIPHLILLDIMMPEMDGVQTCIELRDNNALRDAIVVFLSARTEDYSQVAALDAGGDDFISKPVRPRLLVSKIKSLLRRVASGAKSSTGQQADTGDLRIDRDRYVAVKGDTTIEFPRKEFELLALLASTPGKVFLREDILSSVWGDDVLIGDRTIDVHIRKIREKIGDEYIRTVKGVGYKFVAA